MIIANISFIIQINIIKIRQTTRWITQYSQHIRISKYKQGNPQKYNTNQQLKQQQSQTPITNYISSNIPTQMQIQIRSSTQPIQQLVNQTIQLLQYIVDTQSVLVLTQNGAIMTITEKGVVDVKAQNDDGISSGSLSPAQQYIYVVTKNNTLIQLDMQFDLVKEVPLDDHHQQKVDSYDARFSWKADGSFFAINVMTDKGRKCHTRDNMLNIFRSPSLSDPQPQGLVQSVSEKSRLDMSPLVAWQPSAGIIAGSDYINKNGKKINRVIFWQKNGLRHLQFQLPPLITDVLNISWSLDSQILIVQVLLINSTRWLYLYHRSNYHWYLKQTIQLQQQSTQYIILKNKHNQILILNKQQISIIQYILNTSQQIYYKTQKQQKQNINVLQASIDGNILKVTDFAQGLIPPPMCHCQVKFNNNIKTFAIYNIYVLVITEQDIWICKWNGKNLDQRNQIQITQQLQYILKIPISVKLLQISPIIQFTHANKIYEISQNKLKPTQIQYQPIPYKYNIKQQNKQIIIQLKQHNLYINNQLYIQHCNSYIIYHQFIIFTVTSSNMYDKMFIIDLLLDGLNQIKDSIKVRLEEFQAKKLLNYRAIQRGAKIVGCSKNRVIFELPRGNLQAIYPKIITIKYVRKCLQAKQFKQAFQTIRTHKLDLNLLYDIDPKTFTQHAQQILTGIKRTDYINLFVSQLKDTVSQQLKYCNTQQQIDDVQNYIQINIEGKKIKQVCTIVSQTLRKYDKYKYILSIFTSQIKMGMLDSVLFQIKDMKKDDVQTVVPPHLQQQGNNKKTKKQLSAQQILQYVCWLVDANVIYQASLLTYDIQLASITARCTQMDPKQYIPYLQQLKQITDQLELKRRICMDLKKYQKAVQQLSKGNDKQIRDSIELVKKYKLFKCGLISYASRPQLLRQVKLIVIDQLLSSSQNNQAYKLCLSISAFDKALDIAVKMTDGKKIKEVIECYTDKSKQDRIQMAKKIISNLGEDGFKNKNDLAKLKAYVGQYDEATTLYIRAGNYQKAYKYYVKSSKQYKQSPQFTNGMSLLHSLQKNQLLKEKSQFIQKLARLHKVHKQRSIHGMPSFAVRNQDNDDLYSQVSQSSKTGSSYTVSTTTGLKRKRDKKRSILSRNVKQGSPLQQEYLVAFIVDLQNKVQPNIKQTKLLIQHLIYANMIKQAQNLRNTCKQYAEVASKSNPKFYAQIKFESDFPQYAELLQIYQNKGIIDKEKAKDKKDKYSIDSFNYMF